MTYYLLPKNINKDLDNSIFLCKNNKSMKNINPSLLSYLNDVKHNIDNYKDNWDNIKKITNPYEYIHTIHPTFHTSVSILKPLSRSFYKLIEIINSFEILKNEKNPIKSFHMAEGPGGFVEAFIKSRKNDKDEYYAMTLESSDISVPGWKKSDNLLKEKNLTIERGVTNNGDLFSFKNFEYYLKYKNNFDFITADGGFDFSGDYNEQEKMASKLILIEILYGLMLQKINGTMVIKVYDIYCDLTIDFLYLLTNFYQRIYVYKPHTSRYANSEKYLVCKNLCKNVNNNLLDKFKSIIQDNNLNSINRILNIDIPLYFLLSIEHLNSMFGEQQLENINLTLSLIENFKGKKEKIEQLKKNNLNKCIQWCENNNIPYNKKISTKNIFLDT
jgi:23S rRNA U2552 (ribose-2'-O)-methylase RlmE/FtsJ